MSRSPENSLAMNAQGKIAAASGKVLVFPAPLQPNIRVLVPREHGTWGLLLFPLISGAIVGHYASPNASLKPALWFFFDCSFRISDLSTTGKPFGILPY